MAQDSPIVITAVADVDQASRDIQSFSKSSRTALTSLSLVVQDLPFGFIGIQNNLPGVISAFGKLRSESTSTSNAIKKLLDEFGGPAGAIFTFSALTSILTELTREYGSLYGALQSVFGIQKTVNQIQSEYNKSVLDSINSNKGQRVSLESLVNILTNKNSTLEQITGSYVKLQKEFPGLLNGLDKENITTENSIKLLKQRQALFTQQLILEGKREAIIKAIAKADEKILDATSQLINPDFFQGIKNAFTALFNLDFNPFTKDLTAAKIATEGATREINFYTEKLTALDSELTKITGAIAKFAGETGKVKPFKFKLEEEIDLLSISQKITLLENLGTTILNTKSTELERIDALKQLARLEPEVWGNVKLSDLSYQELRATLIGVGKTYQQLILQDRQRIESLAEVEERIKRQTYENKLYNAQIRREIEAKRELQAIELVPKKLPTTVKTPINVKNIVESANVAKSAIESIQEDANLTNTTNILADTFFNPMQDLFQNFLQTGKTTFQEFVKSVFDAINKLISKIVATGIITLIAAILNPTATAASGGLGALLSKNIGALFGFGKLNLGNNLERISNPSFSGIQGGGMNMKGEVIFVQRGSDLVGVLNRTNTTIGRIG